MSIRGRITYECDQESCHAELVLDADDAAEGLQTGRDISITFTAFGWRRDADDELWCPQCVEDAEDAERRDDSHERAAARARNNDFADTGGKDWT